MAHHSNARILAVDSSLAWIAKVREATADQAERITIEAIDLGELGELGDWASWASWATGAIPAPTATATASATTCTPPGSTAP